MIPVFMRHSPSAGHSDIKVLDKALHLCEIVLGVIEGELCEDARGP